MSQNSLANKRIMITGGSSGLGLSIATQCIAAQAAGVTSLDLQPPPQGVDHAFVDVCKPEDWQTLLQTCAAPDVVFLNAGIMSAPNGAPPEDYRFLNSTHERYQLLRGVNLDGVVLGMQALVPAMPAGGCIIATASMAGLYSYPFDPLYAATKHALVGLVSSVAPELEARGLRIHCFCPNRIVTPLLPEATRTSLDLSPDQAAAAAISLVDEPSSGYAWIYAHADQPMQRHPPAALSLGQRIRRKLFGSDQA